MISEFIITASPILIAAFISAATVFYTLRRQEPMNEATTEQTRAQALSVYWMKIEKLESENTRLKNELQKSEQHYERELEKLRAENQRLWAEIGRLKLKMGGS